MKRKSLLLILLTALAALTATATERTILLGPKTIGRGWKDRIVVRPEQFLKAKAGDIMTLYTVPRRGSAQAAYQHPTTGQALAPELAYFPVKGPVRTTLTAAILAQLQKDGLCIAGHDYQIVRLTIIPAEEMVETVLWKGPSFEMASDWSRNCDIQRSTFQGLQLGDDVRFYVSKVKPGAALKLSDTQWQPFDSGVDGAPVGGDFFTWSLSDQMQLVKLQLADQNGVCMRVGGKGYQLDRITVVRCTAQLDPDESTAQKAPTEYQLRPGELFRGDMDFPADYSQNLRLTAAPFQELDESYAIVVSYKLTEGATDHKMAFREHFGDWHDISGEKEPQWRTLDGRTAVLKLDATTLDKVKTKGIVISGCGFRLTRAQVVKTN